MQEILQANTLPTCLFKDASNSFYVQTIDDLKPISQFNQGTDFIADAAGIIMNPANIIRIKFNLMDTRHANDSPRIDWTTRSSFHIEKLFHPSGECNFFFYLNSHDRRALSKNPHTLIFTYKTLYIMVSIPIQITSSTSDVIHNLYPERLTRAYCEDSRNVHFYKINQGEQIPDFVTARLYHQTITEPICQLLQELYTRAAPDISVVKIPFIYQINITERSFKKIQINQHDVIPLYDLEAFNQFNHDNRVDNCLFTYMFFMFWIICNASTQYMIARNEFTMMFDFYLRRPPESVGYHYDSTEWSVVDNVGLLYSMGDDEIKSGPQLIPYGFDRPFTPNMNANAYGSLVQRGGIIVFNNKHFTHTTPHLASIINRIPYQASYVKSNTDRSQPVGTIVVTPEAGMQLPDELKTRLLQSSQSPRTFLRSWNLVTLSDEQKANTQKKENGEYDFIIMYQGDVFDRIMAEYTTMCEKWKTDEKCDCIDVTAYTAMPKYPGYITGGRMPIQKLAMPKTVNVAAKSNSSSSKSNSSSSKSNSSSSKSNSSSSKSSSSSSKSNSSKSLSHNLKSPIKMKKATSLSSLSSKYMITGLVKSNIMKIKRIIENPSKSVFIKNHKHKPKYSQSVSSKKKSASYTSYTRKVKSI
jgi:hypothetical protein